MSVGKIIILFAIGLCIIAISICTLSNTRAPGTERSDRLTAADPQNSTRRVSDHSNMHSAREDILKTLEAIRDSTPSRQSQFTHQLGSLLVKGLKETGSYREIREVLGELDRSDAKTILQYHIMGAKSGQGIDADFSAQLELIQEYVDPERRGQERFLRFFGEVRGEEGLAPSTFKALSASQQYGLMEGVASSGYAEGLVQNLRDVADDKYRTQIVEHSISIAIKKSPENTVLEIGKLPASPYKDELLAVMIGALVKVGAGVEARDWIGEIGDQGIREATQKVLDQ